MSSKQKSIFTSYKLGVTYSTAKNKSAATKIVYDVAKTKSHCKNNVLDVQNSPTFDIQSINNLNKVVPVADGNRGNSMATKNQIASTI